MYAHMMSYHKNAFSLSLFPIPSTPPTPCTSTYPLTIPQYDGNTSPCSVPGPNNVSLTNTAGSVYRPSPATGSDVSGMSATRHAPWALNRKKQLLRLHQDTYIPDYTITVSPNCQNVIIQCSTGFYTKVALPSLSDIKIGSQFDVKLDSGNVNVHCSDVTGETDNSEANVKAVVFFRLGSNHKVSKGGVTMHLHHTKRKLQIQGGALMPDKTKSPIWFVQNVIGKRFLKLAKSKAFDVSNFNQTIRDLVSSQSNSNPSCAACHIQFTGRSQPELCWHCSKYFHKKCHQSKSHVCLKSGSIVPPVAKATTFSAPTQTALSATPSTTTNSLLLQPLPSSRTVPLNSPPIYLPNHHPPLQPIPPSNANLMDIDVSLPGDQPTDPVPETTAAAVPGHDSRPTLLLANYQHSYIQAGNRTNQAGLPLTAPTNTRSATSAATHHAGTRPSTSYTTSQSTTSVPISATRSDPRPRQAKKALKNTPAIDMSSFTTECLKKQYSSCQNTRN